MLAAKHLENPLSRMQQLLLDAAPVGATTEVRLAAAITETLKAPGSLTRAVLCQQTAATCGLPPEAAEDLAVAVEFFHVASLLLDDLPCMDDADKRRGKTCAHHRFGEASAILAALALINGAYLRLWRALAATDAAPRDRALNWAGHCLGVSGIVNGQALDLSFQPAIHGVREVARIALGKTASLLGLALVVPALAADLSSTESLRLRRLAVYWGLAYQHIDDFKDLVAPHNSGKTGLRDLELKRPNLLLQSDVETANARIERLLGLARKEVFALLGTSSRWSFLQTFNHRLTEKHAAIQPVSPRAMAPFTASAN